MLHYGVLFLSLSWRFFSHVPHIRRGVLLDHQRFLKAHFRSRFSTSPPVWHRKSINIVTNFWVIHESHKRHVHMSRKNQRMKTHSNNKIRRADHAHQFFRCHLLSRIHAGEFMIAITSRLMLMSWGICHRHKENIFMIFLKKSHRRAPPFFHKDRFVLPSYERRLQQREHPMAYRSVPTRFWRIFLVGDP